MSPTTNPVEAASGTTAALAAQGSGRLRSVDALRGFDMVWILGGAELVRAFARMTRQDWLVPQMEHIDWAGLHFYDLIFPLFIFIVGVSLVFSLSKTIARHGRVGALKRVCRRAALLYVLGFIYNGGFRYPWAELHWAGVLERIAAGYFGAGLLFCLCTRRGLLLWCVALLVGYDALMSFVPIRDIHLDKPTFERLAASTGQSDPMQLFLATTNRVRGKYTRGYNLANQVDFLYLPGFKGYGYYDPDGLLSTIPVVATCLLGVFAGLLLQSPLGDQEKLQYLVVGGVVAAALGLLWALHFPIVKRLWSPSYVMLSGGLSALALAGFYWLVEVQGWHRWCEPFVWVGMNCITIYFLKPLVDYNGLGGRLFGGSIEQWLNAHLAFSGDLLVSCAGLGLALWLCRFLYLRKVFLKL